MKEIKVVQIGCGKMSRYTMRYLLEKGCKLVGAFDINQNIISKSINEVFEEVNSNICIEKMTFQHEGRHTIFLAITHVI